MKMWLTQQLAVYCLMTSRKQQNYKIVKNYFHVHMEIGILIHAAATRSYIISIWYLKFSKLSADLPTWSKAKQSGQMHKIEMRTTTKMAHYLSTIEIIGTKCDAKVITLRVNHILHFQVNSIGDFGCFFVGFSLSNYILFDQFGGGAEMKIIRWRSWQI